MNHQNFPNYKLALSLQAFTIKLTYNHFEVLLVKVLCMPCSLKLFLAKNLHYTVIYYRTLSIEIWNDECPSDAGIYISLVPYIGNHSREENIHEFCGFWNDHECFLAAIFYLLIVLTKNTCTVIIFQTWKELRLPHVP